MAVLKVLSVKEGGKSLCSEETLNRLEQEARQLFKEMSEDPPSVGDAIFVEYEHAFCEKHQIGRFGRKTVKDGQVLFHAGPKKVVHPSVYEMDDHNFLDYIRQWREGSYCPVPIDKLLQGPKMPVLIDDGIRPKKSSLNYEQGLFKKISVQESKPITLVNPSFSTMMALKTTVGGYVTLTSTGDRAWERDVMDFINKSNQKLKMLPVQTIRGVAYLGTDVPQWYPNSPWFRLILSPFIVLNKEFKNFKVEFSPERVTTRYEKKKNYIVSSVLERDSPHFVMNPVSLDLMIGRKDQWYFCESNIVIETEQADDVKVSHAPWFVNFPSSLEWEKIECMGKERYVKHVQGKVYDIKGHGTWLSRRARLIPPLGMKWVELEKKGSHWVTYASLRPRRIYGISVEKDREWDVTLFDDAKLVRSLSKIDTNGKVYVEDPIEGHNHTQLNCDSGLYEVLDPLVDQEVPYEKRVVDLLCSEEGRFFKCKELREDGAFFIPGGQHYSIPGLARGQVRPAQTIHTRVADYVVLPSYAGHKFLFPRAGDIEMMCSTISLFATDWVSVAQQVSGFETDAPLVSTDEVSQKILAAVTSCKVTHERASALTATIISDKTGYSVSFLYRYLSVIPGYIVWKIEGGVLQFSHETVMTVKTDGVENARTSDGRSWLDILQGSGSLRESFKFIGRNLRPLIRFLQWNYCMVRQEDKGDHVQLWVRRPKK